MTIILVIVFIAIPVMFSVLGVLVIRKYSNFATLETHNDVAGFIYAVVGVLYAILLAFVVIVVWEQHRESDLRTQLEANCVVDICRDVDVFPDSVKTEIQKNIYLYSRQMIDLEFPAMYKGTTSEEVTKTYEKIWTNIYNYKPDNQFHQIWYLESIREMNELEKERSMRIFGMSQRVPLFMWLVLLTGGFLTIAFSFLFGTKNLWAQLIMVSVLTTMIALIIILIEAFNHPFTGVIHITPYAFEGILPTLEAIIND